MNGGTKAIVSAAREDYARCGRVTLRVEGLPTDAGPERCGSAKGYSVGLSESHTRRIMRTAAFKTTAIDHSAIPPR
jgi:hypothetical protein